MRRFSMLFALLLLMATGAVKAQAPEVWSGADIQQQLKRLNTVGSVLYLAAHPDDENTRLISWLANDACVRTGYLSLTRGDGGQNLIGSEKGAYLGLIRTQELLAARRVDGGEQYFTRAVDFGYSKNPEETFSIWNRDQVLADVVWVIRKFRPDVIITRFPPTSRAGHGHHTASAMLAEEAFELAADPKAFPEQLKLVEVWKPRSLYHNTSTWWYKDLPEKAKNSDEYVTADIGAYNAVLGESYNEIAAISRSQHRSQGFGSARDRGTKIEYMQFVKGEKLDTAGWLSDLGTDWKRYEGTEAVAASLAKAQNEFDINNPAGIVPHLISAYKGLKRHPMRKHLHYKVQEIEEAIFACSGLFIEATADRPEYTFGDEIKVEVDVINRGPLNMKVSHIHVKGSPLTKEVSNLEFNVPVKFEGTVDAPTVANNPYWLNESYDAMFVVKDQKKIGKAENSPTVKALCQIEIDGQTFTVMRPVVYSWVDRAIGELYRPLVIKPEVTGRIESSVYVFPEGDSQEVLTFVTSNLPDGTTLDIGLNAPEGWQVSGGGSTTFATKGEAQVIRFTVTPPAKGSVGSFALKCAVAGETQKVINQQTTIAYEHIPTQTVFEPATAKAIRVEVSKAGERIGYIAGAGDDVPASLRILGYEVDMLEPGNLSTTDLAQYDAIVTGIRAYNTKDELAAHHRYLLDYVKEGGTLVMQYNTAHGLITEDLGPFEFKLSRDRVTREDADVTILNKKHSVLNFPNKITAKDFEGWVQERGLYFPNEWSEAYTPLLSWHDPGEDDKKGALLVAQHGKGMYVYTGISFFRQLPAGVPGAYRLFSNLVSAGQAE